MMITTVDELKGLNVILPISMEFNRPTLLYKPSLVPRLLQAFQCNIEKLGGDWGQGYLSLLYSWIQSAS